MNPIYFWTTALAIVFLPALILVLGCLYDLFIDFMKWVFRRS